MLGEISKRKNDFEAAINYFLKGLDNDSLGYIDNYIDLAEVCEILNESELNTIIISFSKLIT